MNRYPSHDSIMNRPAFQLICLLFLLLCSVASHVLAQDDFCTSPPRIWQMAWSPDGEQLAVTTRQGVYFFDRDLELIMQFQAPSLAYYLPSVPITWSPDSKYIVVPQPPVEYLEYGGGSRLWSIINARTGEIDGKDPLVASSRKLAWSPDNRYLASFTYEDPNGLEPPFAELVVGTGINETHTPTQRRRFQDIQLTDLSWSADNVLTVRVDGLVLSFNIETLEPNAADPYFYPSWWIPSLDGSREAAYKPDTFFYVRENGQEEQAVQVTPYLTSSGEFFTLGQPTDIHWMLDNGHIIAIYPRDFPHVNDKPADLLRTLQGTIIDAVSAVEIKHFFITTETDIRGYAVSSTIDRIALFRDRTRIEIWNPLTEEQIATTDIPAMEFEECD